VDTNQRVEVQVIDPVYIELQAVTVPPTTSAQKQKAALVREERKRKEKLRQLQGKIQKLTTRLSCEKMRSKRLRERMEFLKREYPSQDILAEAIKESAHKNFIGKLLSPEV
jgi:predicted RNase H-like nuclease (RuvC/YqgF family)